MKYSKKIENNPVKWGDHFLNHECVRVTTTNISTRGSLIPNRKQSLYSYTLINGNQCFKIRTHDHRRDIFEHNFNLFSLKMCSKITPPRWLFSNTVNFKYCLVTVSSFNTLTFFKRNIEKLEKTVFYYQLFWWVLTPMQVNDVL